MKTLKHFCMLLLVGAVLAGCSKNGGYPTMKYMAVRVESDEGWSIADSDGKIVLEDEFDSSDNVSFIWGNSFWVKSDGKFSLYEVDDTKKPLTDVEYDHVTEMYNDRALAVRAGHSIKILDGDGKVVADLPTDIIRVSHSYSPYFIFEKSDEKMGWMDKDGHIIKDGMKDVLMGLSDVVVTREKEEGPYLIFDAEGKETGKFKAEYVYAVSSDRIIVRDKDRVILLSTSGKEVATLKKSISYVSEFIGDYATCHNDSYKSGLINKDGEEQLRTKYEELSTMGKNIFQAKKNGKYGIIDPEGEEILDYDYNEIFGILIGSHFIVKEDQRWQIVDSDGKLLGDDFYAINESSCTDWSVSFVDIDALAKEIAQIAADFDYDESVASVGSRLEQEPTSDMKYSSTLETNETVAGHYAAFVYNFDSYIVSELTHQEYDGYWSHTVVDGYSWSSARLNSIKISLSTGYELPYDDGVELIKKALGKKRYQQNQEGEMFATINGQKRRIRFEHTDGDNIVMVISR